MLARKSSSDMKVSLDLVQRRPITNARIQAMSNAQNAAILLSNSQRGREPRSIRRETAAVKLRRLKQSIELFVYTALFAADFSQGLSPPYSRNS